MGESPPDRKSKKSGSKPAEFSPAGAAGDDPLTRNLKKVYDEVAAEPIPEDWMKLLDQIDAKMGGRKE